ncbi:MAG: hypothetical protein R3Y58_13820, partial [Eubacteriales bacterium]
EKDVMCTAMREYVTEKEKTAKIELAQQLIDSTGIEADATEFMEQLEDEKDVMCTAMREYVTEKEKAAKIEGIISMLRDMKFAKEEIIQQLVKQVSISIEEAQKCVY